MDLDGGDFIEVVGSSEFDRKLVFPEGARLRRKALTEPLDLNAFGEPHDGGAPGTLQPGASCFPRRIIDFDEPHRPAVRMLPEAGQCLPPTPVGVAGD